MIRCCSPQHQAHHRSVARRWSVEHQVASCWPLNRSFRGRRCANRAVAHIRVTRRAGWRPLTDHERFLPPNAAQRVDPARPLVLPLGASAHPPREPAAIRRASCERVSAIWLGQMGRVPYGRVDTAPLLPRISRSRLPDTAMAVFYVGFSRWLDDAQERELVDIVREGLDHIKALAAAGCSLHRGWRRSVRRAGGPPRVSDALPA
jgi:hypothetical protein